MIAAAVLAHWREVNTRFEGCLDHMYADIKGLVTVGMGNLIDPVGLALDLPWQSHFGGPVTHDDIEAEWSLIHGNMGLARAGASAAGHETKLHLSDETIDKLIGDRLDANAATLAQHPAFAAFETWPDTAQFAVLSMAWAMGPSFGPHWPRFSAACLARDWDTASRQCLMDETGNPGLAPRNKLNAKLFAAAKLGINLETALKIP